MQIVIEIPEEQKKMVDVIMDLPPQVENDLVSAIRHGKPLDDVLDKIRAEILAYDYSIGHNAQVRWCLFIIDKYREAESEQRIDK